jgi:hypothetical protein
MVRSFADANVYTDEPFFPLAIIHYPLCSIPRKVPSEGIMRLVLSAILTHLIVQSVGSGRERIHRHAFCIFVSPVSSACFTGANAGASSHVMQCCQPGLSLDLPNTMICLCLYCIGPLPSKDSSDSSRASTEAYFIFSRILQFHVWKICEADNRDVWIRHGTPHEYWC